MFYFCFFRTFASVITSDSVIYYVCRGARIFLTPQAQGTIILRDSTFVVCTCNHKTSDTSVLSKIDYQI